MKKIKILFLFAFLISITSCITIGNKFETVNIPEIKIGKTTMEDLMAALGEPYRQGIEDGYPTWTYLYYKLKLLGSKYTRDLYITFDKKGIVTGYTYNTNYPDEEVKVKE